MSEMKNTQDQEDARQKAAEAEAAEERTAEEELEQVREELATMNDRLLRAQAELENYRKRARRELEDSLKYATFPLIRDLLPIVDNVGRAIDAAETGGNADSLVAGVKMVAGELEEVLKRHHCTRIDALEQPFDPNLHEAVAQQPSETYPPQTVVDVVQTGYRLHDRVVRPSQVIISSGPPASAEQGGEDQ